MSERLLDVKDLRVSFFTPNGEVKAVGGVSYHVDKEEVVAIVGESGCGKSVTQMSVMQLIQMPPGKILGGEVIFEGKNLLGYGPKSKEMRAVRGAEISMIFQDPMTSLNPVMTVGDQILEVIRNHHPELSKQEAKKQAGDMLEMVGITAGRYDDYPHQFSGGMKQRVIIAIALACNPQLLIADEPTTALDVTIQAQVLEMIRDLKKKNNTSMLLITHDLGVVAQNCDSVAIIYAGEIVEYGTLCQVYENAMHPYTEGLFGSIPNLETNSRRLAAIDGMMPDPTALPEGCKFADRCKYATEHCRVSSPELAELEGGHKVRCFRYTT